MLPDNRLDFISKIDEPYIDLMTHTRKEFILLDALIKGFDRDVNFKNDGVARCLSIARTNLETALQYAIKALCLMGEIKPEGQSE